MIWQPRPYDIEWTRRLIEGFKTDPAYWAVPFNKSIYLFHRTNRTIALVYGPKDDLFQKMLVIGRILYYTVSHEPQRVTLEMQSQVFGIGKSSVRLEMINDEEQVRGFLMKLVGLLEKSEKK
jgi:hypothetical protein